MAYTQRYKKRPQYKKRPKAKYAKRRYVAPATAVRRVVRSEMNRQEEIKQIASQYGVASPTFTNNDLFTMAPFQGIVLGTSDSQRIGSQIFIKNYIARFTATGALASLNSIIRVVAVWMDKQVAIPTISAANGGVIASELFLGAFKNVNAMVNNKLDHTIVYDRLFKLESKNTNIGNAIFECKIPINQKVTYNTGSVQMKDKNFYVVFMISVPAASGGVASAWQVNVDQLVTYKDS